MKPGDKVICVNSIFIHPRVNIDFKHLPVKDKIYIIREIRQRDGAVLLEEIFNPILYFPRLDIMLEPGFAQNRFRKLEDSELLNEVESFMKEFVESEELVNI